MLLKCGVGEDSWESLRLQGEVHSKGNQSWIFIGRTDVEAETPTLWPPDVKNWLIWKGPDAGKDWGQEEKGATGNEIVGWHHQLKGQKLEQTPGHSEGCGSLVYCSLWGCKESDMTEQLNWTELNCSIHSFFHHHLFWQVIRAYKRYHEIIICLCLLGMF